MKIYVITPPTITIAAWFRRYATALIVIALVVLATLGAGLAQALYSNAAPRFTRLAGFSGSSCGSVGLALELLAIAQNSVARCFAVHAGPNIPPPDPPN